MEDMQQLLQQEHCSVPASVVVPGCVLGFLYEQGARMCVCLQPASRNAQQTHAEVLHRAHLLAFFYRAVCRRMASATSISEQDSTISKASQMEVGDFSMYAVAASGRLVFVLFDLGAGPAEQEAVAHELLLAMWEQEAANEDEATALRMDELDAASKA